MTELAGSVRERYLQVLERIHAAARSAGRDPDSVRLVVVTKTQPVEVAQAVIEAGATILGENYPEEAVGKLQQLGKQSGVEWHMIGHVQSRKAQRAAEAAENVLYLALRTSSVSRTARNEGASRRPARAFRARGAMYAAVL